jgi:hypothetical protein
MATKRQAVDDNAFVRRIRMEGVFTMEIQEDKVELIQVPRVLIDNKTILELIQSALGPHIIEKNIMKLLKRIQELRLEVHTLKNQLREQGK